VRDVIGSAALMAIAILLSNNPAPAASGDPRLGPTCRHINHLIDDQYVEIRSWTEDYVAWDIGLSPADHGAPAGRQPGPQTTEAPFTGVNRDGLRYFAKRVRDVTADDAAIAARLATEPPNPPSIPVSKLLPSLTSLLAEDRQLPALFEALANIPGRRPSAADYRRFAEHERTFRAALAAFADPARALCEVKVLP